MTTFETLKNEFTFHNRCSFNQTHTVDLSFWLNIWSVEWRSFEGKMRTEFEAAWNLTKNSSADHRCLSGAVLTSHSSLLATHCDLPRYKMSNTTVWGPYAFHDGDCHDLWRWYYRTKSNSTSKQSQNSSGGRKFIDLAFFLRNRFFVPVLMLCCVK